MRPAVVAVGQLASRGDSFDIAWADPPFEIWSEGLEAVAKLVEADLLGDEAVICLECPSKADVVGCLPPGLEIVRDLAGSASRVVMIEVAGEAP